jgi:hypothetical protein
MPPVPPLGSGIAPADPVASSAVIESTAQPFRKFTLRGSCVERFFDVTQVPVSHPLGAVAPSKSSRQARVNAPSA